MAHSDVASGMTLSQMSPLAPLITAGHPTALGERVKKLSLQKYEAIAELAAGSIIKHSVYVSSVDNDSEADIEDLNNVLFNFYHPKGLKSLLLNSDGEDYLEGRLFLTFAKDLQTSQEFKIGWPMNKTARKLLLLVLESRRSRTLKELFRLYRKQEKVKTNDSRLLAKLKPTYFAARNAKLLLLEKGNTTKSRFYNHLYPTPYYNILPIK